MYKPKSKNFIIEKLISSMPGKTLIKAMPSNRNNEKQHISNNMINTNNHAPRNIFFKYIVIISHLPTHKEH